MHGITVRPIVSNAKNAGDALRFISQQKIIKYNFVLVSGDVVSNMNLIPILNEHKLRRQTNKSCLVTMILKQAERRNMSRSMQGLCLKREEQSSLAFRFIIYIFLI